ncbi:MAG: hypothetical protein UY03_C0006G0002 [Parcubacteria group bacterium GW2011_GWA2_47_64]|nr:MAG: hypothetical protein UY03_C0006G0002 [Parcubacteria group bacterium GW2011_GWA2_47_64]
MLDYHKTRNDIEFLRERQSREIALVVCDTVVFILHQVDAEELRATPLLL